MAKLNMEEIAKLAGVSLATVSRAIQTPQKVRPKTRARVLSVMEKHNYIYNATAADLSRQKTKVIGLLIPTTRSPVFASSILAIQEECQNNGYSVILGNTQYDAQIEERIIMQFQERRVAGVILTGFTFGSEKAVISLNEVRVPTVVIWEKLEDPRINYVGFDNYQTAYSMTEYLIRLGHQRIGLIIGPYSKVGRVRKRLAGYNSAMEKSGLDIDPTLIIETEPTLTNGYDAMARLLQLSQQPTAVFAASDVLAIGALKAVKDKGLNVPQDISLAGHDDIGFATYTDPPLTTVRVESYIIGRLAVEVLLESIEKGNEDVKQYCLDTDVIIRESCTELK